MGPTLNPPWFRPNNGEPATPVFYRWNVNTRGVGGLSLHWLEVWQRRAAEAFSPWPCLRWKSFISLPSLRRETLFHDPDLFRFSFKCQYFFKNWHFYLHEQDGISSFFHGKKIVGTTHVDRSQQQLLHSFDGFPVQKDTLLKTRAK